MSELKETNFDVVNNNKDKVAFREKVLTVEQGLKNFIEAGDLPDTLSDCLLTHWFTPVVEEYGCCTYAREMFIPKDTLIIGKIHKHQHLNFILTGKVSVSTEFGQKEIEAPAIFISEVGLKRAVFAHEDTRWVTVHITKYTKEEDLNKVEDEVISETYDSLGLIDSTKVLERLMNKGKTS
jgi:hypothetical protein